MDAFNAIPPMSSATPGDAMELPTGLVDGMDPSIFDDALM